MARDLPRPIVVITGPTASGKSQFALDLAVYCHGIILNADSVQLYRDLPILSASPSCADKSKIQHYFYNTLDPFAQWNAVLWCRRVLEFLETSEAQDRPAILVGGTGLYLKALMTGLIHIPDIHPKYRRVACQELIKRGSCQFFQDLAAIDFETAQRLDPRNTHRLIRAWEVYHGTGKPLSYWQNQPTDCQTTAYRFITFYLNPAKSDLVERADQRFDAMMAQDALHEVQNLLDKNVTEDAPIYKTLGARPLTDYLKGHLSYEQAALRAKISTHQYIKRQQTWFRHQLTPCHTIDDFYSKEALRYAQSVLKEINYKGHFHPS